MRFVAIFDTPCQAAYEFIFAQRVFVQPFTLRKIAPQDFHAIDDRARHDHKEKHEEHDEVQRELTRIIPNTNNAESEDGHNQDRKEEIETKRPPTRKVAGRTREIIPIGARSRFCWFGRDVGQGEFNRALVLRAAALGHATARCATADRFGHRTAAHRGEGTRLLLQRG